MAQQQDYAIHYRPPFTTLQAMSVRELIERASDPWYNQALGQAGDGSPARSPRENAVRASLQPGLSTLLGYAPAEAG